MVYSTRRFVLSFALCYFVIVFFSPFSIAITSLGEEKAILSAFRTFVRFALVWFCLLSLPLGIWYGLRLVIVALPRLFSYLFWIYFTEPHNETRGLRGKRKQWRSRSAQIYTLIMNFACLTSPYSTLPSDSISWQWGSWSDCADAQVYMDLRCPHTWCICLKTRFRMSHGPLIF